MTLIQLIAPSNSQTTRNIIPCTAGLVLVTSTWGMCFQRPWLLADNSTPSPAVRLNRAGSMESSYHLFRSEPAAARILRAEVSLKINCLGSGRVSDRTEPTWPQGATGNQAQHWWLNRCLLNNQEGSTANQKINLFSRLLILPPTSQQKERVHGCWNWKQMPSWSVSWDWQRFLYVFVLRTTMLISHWKWNHKLKILHSWII